MARRSDITPEVRERLAKWLRWYKDERRLTNEALGNVLGLAEPTITNILNRRRTAGLEVLVKMHWHLHVQADTLIDVDPPTAEQRAPERGQALTPDERKRRAHELLEQDRVKDEAMRQSILAKRKKKSAG